MQALRPQIRIAFQHAARNTGIRQARQVFEWTNEISWNLKLDLNVDEIEAELGPDYAAFSETMRFLTYTTSIAFLHLPRPKDRDQFMVLAQKVCEAFHSVIAGSRSGLVSTHRLAAAQDTIINAFNELRQPDL